MTAWGHEAERLFDERPDLLTSFVLALSELMIGGISLTSGHAPMFVELR